MRFLLPLCVGLAGPLSAEPPRVVTDIVPVQALVADIMGQVVTPDLLIPEGASTHHYAMRPSEARALAAADLVFWVGPALTPPLEDAIAKLAPEAQVVVLSQEPGLVTLTPREGALFAAHDHGHEDGHGHEVEEHEHEGEEHADAEEEHEHEGEEHAEAAIDPHLWLDPDNAVIWVQAIANTLAARDPENAETYLSNAAATQQRIEAAKAEVQQMLAPVRGQPFVVLHDGFHYFEAAFGIEALAAVGDSDAATPGAARIATLRTALMDSGVRCAFTEPQQDARLLKTVTEGLPVKIGVLDPLGRRGADGRYDYPDLLTNIGQSLADCLGR